MSFVAIAVLTGVSTLNQIINKPEQKGIPANASPLGAQGQGIAAINVEDIGSDTEDIADDIDITKTSDFDIASAEQDKGIISALQNKLGAKTGRPITSFEDMSLEELLAVLSMDELTDIPKSDLTIDDVMDVVTPNTAMPKPEVDTGNLVSLYEQPNVTEAIANVTTDVETSMPSSNTATTAAAMAATPTEGAALSPGEVTAIMQGLATLAELLDDDEKPLAPASAPRFSYQAPSGGIKLSNIGMNMGGEPSKVLARPMFNGNPVVGPGGPKDDIIPVLASDGEFMLSKAAVDHAGGGNHALGIERLKAFNNKGNQKYG